MFYSCITPTMGGFRCLKLSNKGLSDTFMPITNYLGTLHKVKLKYCTFQNNKQATPRLF